MNPPACRCGATFTSYKARRDHVSTCMKPMQHSLPPEVAQDDNRVRNSRREVSVLLTAAVMASMTDTGHRG
jgi:hypothetical protein